MEKYLCSVERTKIKRVFNVGDSQTDTNNFWQYSQYLTGHNTNVNSSITDMYPDIVGWIPRSFFSLAGLSPLPSRPYWNGRFSDGPVGSELIAGSLGLPPESFINYAHGGSPTMDYADYLESFWWANQSEGPELATLLNLVNSVLNGKWMQVSLERQVEVLLRNYKTLNKSDLVVVSGGGNDYLNEYWDPERIVRTQVEIIRSILGSGAGILVWGTLPDITKTPCLKEADRKSSLKRVVSRHNEKVDDAFLSLKKEYPDQLLLFVDSAALFESLLIEAEFKGMNIDSSCTGVSFVGCFDKHSTDIRNSSGVIPCSNPNDYFYWDSVHPTSRVNRWMNVIACHFLDLLNVKVQCTLDDDLDVIEVFERAKLITKSKATDEQLGMLLEGTCPDRHVLDRVRLLRN